MNLNTPTQSVDAVADDLFATLRCERRGVVGLVKNNGQAGAPRVGIDVAETGALRDNLKDVVGVATSSSSPTVVAFLFFSVADGSRAQTVRYPPSTAMLVPVM